MFNCKTQLFNQFINIEALDEFLGPEVIAQICEVAKTNNFASITALPRYIPQAWNILKGSSTKIASVVNFPHGDSSLEELVTETKNIYETGIDEIELILPYQNFLKNSDPTIIYNFVNAVKDIILERKSLKVNIEASQLNSSHYIHQICETLAHEGINFIKNSSCNGHTNIFQINAILEDISQYPNDCGIDVFIEPKDFCDMENIMRLLQMTMPKISNITKRNLRFSLSLETFNQLSSIK